MPDSHPDRSGSPRPCRGDAAAHGAFERRWITALRGSRRRRTGRARPPSAAAPSSGVHAKVARFSTDRCATTWSGARRWRASCSPACASVAASVAVGAARDPGRSAADDEGQQAGFAAEPPEVEDELRRALGVRVQRDQRLGQDAARAVRVDGGDRLVAQAPPPARPTPASCGRDQARRLDRARGDDDPVGRRAVDLPRAGRVARADRRGARGGSSRRRLRARPAPARGNTSPSRRRGSSRSAPPALPASASCRTRRNTEPLASRRRRVQRGDAQAAR